MIRTFDEETISSLFPNLLDIYPAIKDRRFNKALTKAEPNADKTNILSVQLEESYTKEKGVAGKDFTVDEIERLCYGLQKWGHDWQ